MYINLIKSYLQLFLSRGESYPLAKFSTACALSITMAVNLTTLMVIFADLSFGRAFLWVGTRPWMLAGFLVSLVAANFLLTKTVPSAELRDTSTSLCYWHMSVSLGFFLIASVVGIARM